jgi:lysophospholipase L1-like esterase
MTADAGMPHDRLSPRAKWAALVVLTLGTLLLLLAAAEIAIRVRQALRYGTASTIEETYTLDRKLGLRVPIANLSKGHIAVNSLGFRGPEIAMPKPPGTVRLAFVGASTTWCGEVSGNDKVWADIVTRSLADTFPAHRFDYVNGGVPGYTIPASRKNLELRIAPLAPDIIVIYEGMNDLSGELREVAAAKGVARDAKLEPASWLADYSLLWNLAEKNLRVWFAQRRVESAEGRLVLDAGALGDGFRRDLTGLVQAAQQRAKRVAVATFSIQLRSGQSADEQLRAAASRLYYEPFMTPQGIIDAYRRYNEIVREVAAATGALLIEGEDDIPGDPAHFADTVHFTDAGSAAMAARVTRALARDQAVRGIVAE